MSSRGLKTIGLFVLILVFVVTVAACEMAGDGAVGDVVDDSEAVSDSETGELEVRIGDITLLDEETETPEIGTQSVLDNRYEDFELEVYIEYQNDRNINYDETIDLDDSAITKDNLGENHSVTFTALLESTYDVTVTLTGYNINTEERVDIAYGEGEEDVIAGLKRDITIEIQQKLGDLNITVDQFPSEETGGELIEKVNVKLLDLDGEELEEMDFDYDIEGQNLLVEDLYPAYYTMVISWDGHGDVEEKADVRVLPGKTKEIPVELYGSQLSVDVDWKAEPPRPENIAVTQTEDGFEITWDGVENTDRYHVLRKRDPYYHDNFAKVGEVEHSGVGEEHEFEYDVEKDELFDIATYDFRVVSVREHEGKEYDLTSEARGPSTIVYDSTTGATAWGGGIEGPDKAWWWYYDTAGDETQYIYANRDIKIGTVEIYENEENDGVKIEMELYDGWNLQDDDESVKIQGYEDKDAIPGSRPAAGLFETYKGDALSIELTDVDIGDFDFYAIHLDVEGFEEIEVD